MARGYLIAFWCVLAAECGWAATAPITRIDGTGTSATYAFDFNEGGTAVGRVGAGPGNLHVMRYPSGGPTQDLGTLGGQQATAFAVNSTGTITGESQIAGGQWRAFRYLGAARGRCRTWARSAASSAPRPT
jgi:probable HAF family extracellular repeat protein